MPRKIEIELTSQRNDGYWTWRAVGAREPKGLLANAMLAFDAKVGDLLTLEAEFNMDGIEIVGAFQQQPKNTPLPETLEILGSKSDQPLVTTQLVSNDKSNDRRSKDSQNRNKKAENRRQHNRERDAEPKFKRLRPNRIHREALIKELPEDQKAVAAKIMRDGISATEQTLRLKRKKQRQMQDSNNNTAQVDKADTNSELDMIRDLLIPMRAAEWRDRADAALAGFAELDLRDLRSVVGAADLGAVDEVAKALAEQLRSQLTARVDKEHSEWLAEVAATLADGRMIRALRLSTRPPKAGVPLPQDIVTRLTEAASAALNNETPSKRWMMVLGAVAFSPVRRTVQPHGIPDKPDQELLAEVKKLSERVPHIAALFGIDPTPPPKRSKRNQKPQAAKQ